MVKDSDYHTTLTDIFTKELDLLITGQAEAGVIYRIVY